MKEQLDEYARLCESMKLIKSIKSDNRYDKKGWYLSGRDYVSDFGVFKASYTAGTYGSSSVSNQLSGLHTDEGKREFEKFLCSQMENILDQFLIYYKKKLQKMAYEQKQQHVESIKRLDNLFSIEELESK